MTKVKICGLKREEDIEYVNRLMPDYVGFVFAESRRQVKKIQAKKLIADLVPEIKKVGVFLNQSAPEVEDIAGYCGLDILQFHGEEEPAYCSSFQYEVWKAFRVKDQAGLERIEEYTVNGLLFDTFVAGQYGGTGETFNWELVSDITREKFVILSGGLHLENVGQAIRTVQPAVVDVSSGVETDGNKDFSKMKSFMENAKKFNPTSVS